VIANAIRICVALEIQRRSFEVSGLSANQLHRVEGIVVYFGFLMLLFLIVEQRGSRKMWLFPLVIYYAMTLGVPFVNGSFHRIGFWEHFGFVMVMPLIIVVPILLVRLFLTTDYTDLRQQIYWRNAMSCKSGTNIL
jgi:magnesium-transporting ATPase (P-type)